jgi:hypothetical protein
VSDTTTHHAPGLKQRCIDNCTECHAVCLTTAVHALKKGGGHAEEAHIRLLLDCAEICQAALNFMLRDSPLHKLTCGACAEVCARCAEACERFPDDPQMVACAEICRKCAATCREMAAG